MSTILVIDDSVSIIAFLTSTLTAAGHTVTTAPNGRLGLDQMRQQRFDLVITDLYMPEADGIETIRRARAAGLLTRLIAMSSRDSIINLLPVARLMGAMRTIPKPFTAEQLLAEVEAVLRIPVPRTGAASVSGGIGATPRPREGGAAAHAP